MKENFTQSWGCTVSPVSEYLQPLLSSRPLHPPSSARISMADLSLVHSMCFYPWGCLRFSLDDCCRLDTRIPLNNGRRKRWVNRVSYHIHRSLKRTQVIHYCYQRKSTAHMEHYVAFHQLTYEWVHCYNQFGYWLASFSYPQRMFTPSMITSFMRSCAQATLVENCFSNLGSKYSTVARNIRQPTAV